MRNLALLPAFLSMHLKTMMQYRTNFFMGAISQLIYALLSAVFVGAFMQPGDTLQGWSFWQIIFLFGFGDLSFGLSAIFLFRIFLSFESEYIIQGKLDQLLVQPLPILYSLILRTIDLNHLAVVLKGIGLVALSAHMLGMAWTGIGIVSLAFLAVCGAVVYGGVYLAIVSLGFWFRRRASLAPALLSLNYLIQYPVSIYPGPIQVALTFVLPIGLATFYPARIFLDIAAPSAIATVQFWMLPPLALLIVAIGAGIFHLGLRSYASSGT